MFIDLTHRSQKEEIMDELSISGEVVIQTLKELHVINTLLGGNQLSARLFKKLVQGKKHVTLMDMGTGGGDQMRYLDKAAQKLGLSTKMTGIDANPNIVAYATQNLSSEEHLGAHEADVFDEVLYEKPVDVIHACLFTHHFSHEQLVELFRRWKATAEIGVIINDLHRNPLAYYSIQWLTRLFSKSYMVRNDAALSVARGFKRKEIVSILKEAGIADYQIKWHWAFRWSIVF